MAVVRDVHVRRLFRLLAQGRCLSESARKAGIDRKTARRYRNMQRLPSERPDLPRGWRTREDPFVEVWPEVAEQLNREPALQAKTLWIGCGRSIRDGSPTGRFGPSSGGYTSGGRRQGRDRKCISAKCIHPANCAPRTSRIWGA